MTISNYLIIICVILLYVIVPIVLVVFLSKNKKYNAALWVVYSVFIIVLLVGVLGKIDIGEQYTRVYLDFSAMWADKPINISMQTTKMDFLINISMLIPIGECVCLLAKNKKSKWGIVIALCFGLICGFGIETMQFILPVHRSVQLSDFVYNTISVVIGYLYVSAIYYIKLGIRNIKNSAGRAQN